MFKYLRPFSLILVILMSFPVHAEDTPFEFKDPVMQDRYMNLIKQIRCLVCQNESLADSQADLAGDLRKDIFNMMGNGKSNKQIVDFLVQRYGDFVLYRPPFQGTTVLLWVLPFVFLVVAIFSVIYFVRLRSADGGTDLSQDEKDKLEQVLGDSQNEV
jgi:cytochrome c-type biogenesis protein CcmH